MSDLPIFSEAMFRGANRFDSVDRARGMNLDPVLERFDRMLDHGEGNAPAGDARRALAGGSPSALLAVHRLLFPGREASGELRVSAVAAIYPGQDCPDPEHIAASLRTLGQWMEAESFGEMHPIEQAALVLTRIVDVWPFEYGNRTAAVVFANQRLLSAGYPPFFVLPDQLGEFEQILHRAIRMETEPLVRAIYKCMERELGRVGG
jgi:fido (protein-threonine AMPylation protein)